MKRVLALVSFKRDLTMTKFAKLFRNSNYHKGADMKRKIKLKKVSGIVTAVFVAAFLCFGLFPVTEIKTNQSTNAVQAKSAATASYSIVDNNGVKLNDGEYHYLPAVVTFCAAPQAAEPADPIAELLPVEMSAKFKVVVKPDNAVYKSVDWTVEFLNDQSEWAKGKDVSDYVTITPTSNGATTAVATCKAAFGEKVKLTVVSRNNPQANATSILEYKDFDAASAVAPAVKDKSQDDRLAGDAFDMDVTELDDSIKVSDVTIDNSKIVYNDTYKITYRRGKSTSTLGLFEKGSEYGLSKINGGNYPETYTATEKEIVISNLKSYFSCGGAKSDYHNGAGLDGAAEYRFRGWYLDSDLTIPFDGKIPAGTVGDITIYAYIQMTCTHNY